MSGQITMTSEGSAGRALRRALGPAMSVYGVVDMWSIQLDGSSRGYCAVAREVNDTHEITFIAARRGRKRMEFTVIRANRDPVRTRELTRHLVRQVVHGVLPIIPTTTDEQKLWNAAAHVFNVHTERFPSIEELVRR